jgi:multiple sugar transport system ATP-binding protein
MIAGLDDISSGDIEIGGKRVNDLSPKDRDIAMVFQSYALYPSMSVRKNISFGLEIRKMPQGEIDATVERVAQMLQMTHLLDRKPSQLSGGQRQRVAMGRAWRATRPSSCLTSRCPIWTPSCGWKCAPKSS